MSENRKLVWTYRKLVWATLVVLSVLVFYLFTQLHAQTNKLKVRTQQLEESTRVLTAVAMAEAARIQELEEHADAGTLPQ